MKRLLATCSLAAVVCAGTAFAADPELKTDDDKTIYALGAYLAQRGQITSFGFTPDELKLLMAGFGEVAKGSPSRVDLQTFMPKVQEMAQKRIAATQAAAAVVQKQKGKEYMEKINQKPGLKKTPSGVVMDISAEGTGKSPVPNDRIKVNYKGSTIDGHVFDASERHGGPAEFTLDKDLVKCWNEAFEYLKPGGKATIYCPPDTAYGDQGRGADIPPGATLVFEVELIEIVKLPPAPAK